MESILHELFEGKYNPIPQQDGTQQELQKKLCVEWDKVQRMFGREFVDRLTALEVDQDKWRTFQYYQAGIRLGARLMLEALSAQP